MQDLVTNPSELQDEELEQGNELPPWEPQVSGDLWSNDPIVYRSDLFDLAARMERMIKSDVFTIRDNGSSYGDSVPGLVFKVVDALRKAGLQIGPAPVYASRSEERRIAHQMKRYSEVE